MPRKEMPAQAGGESAKMDESPSPALPLATSAGKSRKRVAAVKPPRPATRDLPTTWNVQDAPLPPSGEASQAADAMPPNSNLSDSINPSLRKASPAAGTMSPDLGVLDSIHPSLRRGRPAKGSLSPVEVVPDADIPLDEIIASIRQLYREHRGLQAAAGDMVRRIKSAERWAAVGRCSAQGVASLEGKFPEVSSEDEAQVKWRFRSFYFVHSEIERNRKSVKSKIDHLARKLPAAEWFTSFRGLGIGSLGAIIGCTGDLSNYPNPAKLWKRLGLDVTPQGKAPKRIAGVKSDYNPVRRAEVRMIGSAILRAGGEGGWADVYRQRKTYEISRAQASGLTILPAARIASRKDKSGLISDGHIHNRALRYMEKRLIRDLWRQWTGRGQEWVEPCRLAAD